VNLMQLDAGRIESLVTSLHPMWDSLLQIIGYSTLLWFVLGPCAFAGFAIMASLIPINTLIFKRLSAYRQQMLRQVTHCCNGYTFCTLQFTVTQCSLHVCVCSSIRSSITVLSKAALRERVQVLSVASTYYKL
jgi:hypothetical protein